jgi:hypothetical protein
VEATLVGFLNGLSSKIFWFAALAFLLLNGAAVVAFGMTRSRWLVNEWTGKLVAVDAVLVGAGLGVPLLTGLAKIGVHALAAMFGGGATPAREPSPNQPPPRPRHPVPLSPRPRVPPDPARIRFPRI